jgi:hypothetical protein
MVSYQISVVLIVVVAVIVVGCHRRGYKNKFKNTVTNIVGGRGRGHC